MTATIQLTGWTLVHTWQEPHGNGHDDIYQRDTYKYGSNEVELLTVCTRRLAAATNIRMETSTHDYLRAAVILANIDGEYEQVGERSISPCCTSGHQDWRYKPTGNTYRFVSIAGHGAYAYALEAD